MSKLIINSELVLVESGQGTNKFKAIFIKAGLTSTANQVFNGKRVKKFYEEEALRKAVEEGKFDNAPLIYRTEQEHLSMQNTGVENIVGYVTESKWDDKIKGVVGEFKTKAGGKLAESFKGFLNKIISAKKNIGLSIYGSGEGNLTHNNQGEIIYKINSIDAIHSIDPCSEGNAGGAVIAFAESKEFQDEIHNYINKHFTESKIKTMNLTPKQLIALFAFLATANKIEAGKKFEDFTADELKKLATEEEIKKIVADNPEPAPPPAEPPAEPPKEPPAEPKKTEPNPDIEAMQKTLAEAKRVLNESNFNNILSESKLPEIIKSTIRERYRAVNFEFKPEFLKSELESTQKILAEAKLDKPHIEIGMEQQDKNQLACDWLMLSSHAKAKLSDEDKKKFAEAGVTGLYSIRRFYEDFTGDRDVTGIYSKDKMPLAEAISTTSFAYILGSSLHRSMIKEFQLSPYNQDWRKLVTIVPRGDYKTNTLIAFGGYGDLPIVTERSAFLETTTPAEEQVTYSLKKRGYIETVSREAILNDDLRQIQNISTKFGRAAARTLYKFVFNLILSNPAMPYDTKTLFHADHKNLGSSALDAAALYEARKAMHNQKEITTNEPLGIMPKYLLVPIELEKTAYELTTPAYNKYNQVPDFVQTLRLEPILIANTTDANDWYLVADAAENPTIEIAFLNGKEEPEIFIQDNPLIGQVFSNDYLSYKIRHEYSGAIENHRSFYGSIVANE